MAYDEHLGERIVTVLKEKHVRYETKNMIGGLCFMINDKMAIGVVNNSLLARIDPEIYQSSLKKKGCRPMDFTGRIMKGFVCVDPIGIDSEKDLEYWIQVCLDFNPMAKSSKKSPAKEKPKPAGRTGKKRR